MITPQNILKHELIGLKVRIIEATHRGYLMEGTIIDETRNTLTIRKGKEETTKKIPKDCVKLEVLLPDGKEKVRIDGRLLLGRPEDRIKKKHRITF